MLAAVATEQSVFVGAGWLNTAHWTASVRTIKITTRMILASLIIPTPGNLLPNAAWETVRRGKSATRRAAILTESNSVDGLPGSDVIVLTASNKWRMPEQIKTRKAPAPWSPRSPRGSTLCADGSSPDST